MTKLQLAFRGSRASNRQSSHRRAEMNSESLADFASGKSALHARFFPENADVRSAFSNVFDEFTLERKTANAFAKNFTESRHETLERESRTLPEESRVLPTAEEPEEEFIVQYEGRKYDIQGMLRFHPGGRRTLGAFKGSSLDAVLANNPHSEAAFHLFEEFVLDNKREYDDIERLVDWNAPLLSQVSTLGDRYWEWVNLPVNRPIRLFGTDILEFLTITPWYLVPMVWIPISSYFLHLGITRDISGRVFESLPEISLSFGLGVLLWTFIEYGLHRKLFHMKPPPDSKILITLHFLLHGLHHKAPFDGRRLVFPPIPAILVAVFLFSIFKTVIPAKMINLVAAGVIIGYLCYDMAHYYLHYGAPNADSYFYVMKRHHNYHHFSHHEQGFGISSRLWDYLFGTLIILRQLARAIEW